MTVATGCLCGTGGTVCTVNVADGSFDQFLQQPSATLISWMQAHYARMLVYPPTRLSWYLNAWAYKDTYAIYVGSPLAASHPDWILRDAYGNKLYIPYACGGGTCPQYAGDVGNPAFRSNWIDEARATMTAGYRGLYLDDFNMRLQIGDGNGNLVTPMNPRTGRAMTVDEWRSSMADLATELRAALPNAEVVQNQVYFFAPPTDPDVVRATQHASYVWVERACNDAGLVGGTGTYGFETLLAFIDAVHADGAGTIEHIEVSSGRELAAACFFLTSTGSDGLVNASTSLPTNWWSGNDVDLGNPVSARYRWNGLFRRDFVRGMVLVNQPGSPTITVDLPGTYTRLDGTPVTRVTLGASDGAVLVPG
jgi:putative glycosyl hydrolase-like family 15 (GHL15) protein